MVKSSDNEHNFTLHFEELTNEDHKLIDEAISVLKANYHPIKHQVSSAVKASSGKIYSAVNVYSSGDPVHAEAIALGMAISAGEREFVSIVALKKTGDDYPIISPCGNCRQLLLDYASQSTIIFNFKGKILKAKANQLLPGPYENSFTAISRSGMQDTPE